MNSKSSNLNADNSNLKKLSGLGSNKLNVLPSINSKFNDLNKKATTNKNSYVDNLTENDIKEDITDKRCKLMMSKLNDLTLEKEKLLKTKQLEPLNKNIAAKGFLSNLNTKSKKTASMSSRPGSSKSDSLVSEIEPNTNKNIDKKSESEESDEEDYGVRKEIVAPNELLEEFLVYVMKKKWEDAKKLCNFILMYEPNNKQAKEFLPLIESKLNEEESESEDDDDDDDDDNEDDDSDDLNDDEEKSDDDKDSEEEDETDVKVNDISIKKRETNDIEYDDDDDVQTPRNSIKKFQICD